jgi:type IV pilus assembly protein PilB
MSARIGELALAAGAVTEDQLGEASSHQKENGGRLGSALVALRLMSETQVAELVARQYGLGTTDDLDTLDVPQDVLATVPRSHCVAHGVLPLSRNASELRLAMADPTDAFAVDAIQFRTGLKVRAVVAAETAIARAIGRLYGEDAGLTRGREGEPPATRRPLDLRPCDISVADVEMDADGAEGPATRGVLSGPRPAGAEEIDLASLARGTADRPVVGLVNRILVEAYRRGASDVHLEPQEGGVCVRLRVDGVLVDFALLPSRLREPLATRIKIMASLDITERRLPQSGRLKVRIRHGDRARELDFRVSVMPTLHGEKAVMRLLDKATLVHDLAKLGFEEEPLRRFREAISRPHGIVLVTGPTGSGKTSTLYSALSTLNRRDLNIMTAEDPIEFDLSGLNQVQIREAVGLTFAVALREFLRQDPNVILVGEIRDYETAEIAFKAALTGHLVLSTLHTNDAPSTVCRLVNMGVEPFLVGTAVNLVQAQRLVRRICGECSEDVTAECRAEVLVQAGFEPGEITALRLRRGRGCAACGGTGYRGRIGLYEVMEVSDAIRERVMVGATAIDIKRQALAEGMLTLRASGLEKVRQGTTSLEEVLRETVR